MKTKNLLPAIAFLLMVSAISFRCNDRPEKVIIAFYNVENLFDTINQNGTRDGEFTPESKLEWNTEKYEKKLHDLAKVITAIDPAHLPIVIGLAEVENRMVVEDLANRTVLGSAGYGVVHYESPDERGIDVALLYRKNYFEPLFSKTYSLGFSFDPDDKTRDMLYVKGVSPLQDTLHLMIDHWPSRSGGAEESAPKRLAAARSVKMVADSILAVVPDASIIIMGDLNDNPIDPSIVEILKAEKPVGDVSNNRLYNLATEKFEQGEGTLYWRSWDLFDQMIVSGNVLKNDGPYHLQPAEIQIVKEDWMLFERNDGVKVPNRTAGRNAYYGGFSDHLPVYIEFVRNNTTDVL
ncbi:MAG: endonuclease/exonuclease/phosphatase family protein [Bacteroidales bacterium]